MRRSPKAGAAATITAATITRDATTTPATIGFCVSVSGTTGFTRNWANFTPRVTTRASTRHTTMATSTTRWAKRMTNTTPTAQYRTFATATHGPIRGGLIIVPTVITSPTAMAAHTTVMAASSAVIPMADNP